MAKHRGTVVSIAVFAFGLLASAAAGADEIDTEHIFGFMIGSDIGLVGERELQSQTSARLGKTGGRYRSGDQELSLEWVPAKDIRIEIGSDWSAHQIAGIPGLPDSRGFAWQGGSVEARYRLSDRATGPFGMTLALAGEFSRIDDTSAARVQNYGAGLTLAVDREIVPDRAVAALNLIYQSEISLHPDMARVEREAVLGASLGAMMRVSDAIMLGGEVRYLRRYDGSNFDALAGHALFIGPTAYFQLSDRSRLTVNWSTQVWGGASRSAAALDLVNFERHQARLTFGINF